MKSTLLALALLSLPLSAKVLIFTYAYSRPDFIELQHKCFQQFLHDDYEFIVFNDAKDKEIQKEIDSECRKFGLQCIHIPQEIHERPYLKRPSHGPFAGYQQGSVRNCNVVQYSLNEVGFKHDDIVAVFDSDMFIIKDFSIAEYMKGKDVAGYKRMCYDFTQHSCPKEHPGKDPFGYFWIGIAFLNMKTMPNPTSINFNCGFVEGNNKVDAGGFTYHYITNNPQANFDYFTRIQVPELICSNCTKTRKTCTHNEDIILKRGFNEKDVVFLQNAPYFNFELPYPEWFVEYYLDGTFLHFRGGTRDTKYGKKERYVVPFVRELITNSYKS